MGIARREAIGRGMREKREERDILGAWFLGVLVDSKI